MHADAPSSLASLLTPDGAAQFTRDHWPHREFWWTADRAGWPDFLRLDAWSDPARIQQMHAGPLQATRGFIAQHPVAGPRLQTWVTDLGLACLLSDLHTSLPGAAGWLAGLERELRLPPGAARLNAFVNPPGVGLGVHCDPREHLLVHVAGRKRIRLLANPAGRYVSASHSATCTPNAEECVQYPKGLPGWTQLPDEAAELTLEPGSVLFMPRGTYHETQGTGDGISTSLVVQFELASYADLVVSYLRRYLVQDERWRAPVAAPAQLRGEQAPAAELRSLLAELGRRLPELSAARILTGSLPAAALQREDRYVRNPSVFVSSAAAPDGTVNVRLTKACGRGAVHSVALGADAAALVQALCQIAEPIAFGDLVARFAEWSEDALASSVAFLVRQEAWIALRTEPYRG